MSINISHGTVHTLRDDMRDAILPDATLIGLWQLWQALTPLGRNEFICWVDDAKQAATRARRIRRTCEELRDGMKRPCCWSGWLHWTDKPPSRWQRAVLIDKKRR